MMMQFAFPFIAKPQLKPAPVASASERFKRIPRSLRGLPLFYVTEEPEQPIGMRRHVPPVRYSALTLSALRPNSPSDLTTYKESIITLEDNFWLSGLGICLTPPWVGVVIQNGLHCTGTPFRPILELTKELGGYWEVGPQPSDIQGIIRSDRPIQGNLTEYKFFKVYLCTDGLLNLTGKPIRGRANDPNKTSQPALERFLEATIGGKRHA